MVPGANQAGRSTHRRSMRLLTTRPRSRGPPWTRRCPWQCRFRQSQPTCPASRISSSVGIRRRGLFHRNTASRTSCSCEHLSFECYNREIEWNVPIRPITILDTPQTPLRMRYICIGFCCWSFWQDPLKLSHTRFRVARYTMLANRASW